MNPITPEELVRLIRLIWADGKASPHIRLGQAAYNALWDIRPDIARSIQGTGVDPFYRDDRMNDFMKTVLNYGK